MKKITTNSKVFLATNGCPENRMDMARMQEFLKENDWVITNTVEDADLILFNTCGLTQYREDMSIKILNQLKARKKTSAELIAFGCLPRINKKRFRENYQGFTFGSDEIERITEIIKTKTNGRDVHANYLIPAITDASGDKWKIPELKKLGSLMSIQHRVMTKSYNRFCSIINVYRPYSFLIKVATGCSMACAFCAVRLSRGKVRSKPIQQVAKEFDEGLAKGYSEFALIGTDVGSYGRDKGTNLAALLQELTTRNGEYKIRLRNLHPRFLIEMMPELQEIFMTGKISYLGSAAESGNNRILKLMRREYCIEDYKEAIHIINKKFPDIQICTQFIAGFPSETEEEFEDTLKILDELIFDIAEVYMFSPRINTIAAQMDNQIPERIAKKRYLRLLRKSLSNQKERKKRALEEHKKNLQLHFSKLSLKGLEKL